MCNEKIGGPPNFVTSQEVVGSPNVHVVSVGRMDEPPPNVSNRKFDGPQNGIYNILYFYVKLKLQGSRMWHLEVVFSSM